MILFLCKGTVFNLFIFFTFTYNRLTKVFAQIPNPNKNDCKIDSFTFGILDSDSTLVYYKIHFGLIPPIE